MTHARRPDPIEPPVHEVTAGGPSSVGVDVMGGDPMVPLWRSTVWLTALAMLVSAWFAVRVQVSQLRGDIERFEAQRAEAISASRQLRFRRSDIGATRALEARGQAAGLVPVERRPAPPRESP